MDRKAGTAEREAHEAEAEAEAERETLRGKVRGGVIQTEICRVWSCGSFLKNRKIPV